MSGRGHSRSGAASGHGVRSGVGNLQGTPTPDTPDNDRQAFAGSGQFTGRDIPTQDTPAHTDAPEASTDSGEEPVPESELDVLQQERDTFRADLQRLAADFENFRKRAQRERELAASAADAKLLGELLVVLDDFERALDHSGDEEPGSAHAQLADGIRMVHTRLLGTLEQHGLSAIESDGMAFDPHLHEAILAQPASDGVAPGHVMKTVQNGYRLGDRVLRHAKVIVAEDGD